jgi:hypothetical protein
MNGVIPLCMTLEEDNNFLVFGQESNSHHHAVHYFHFIAVCSPYPFSVTEIFLPCGDSY